MSTNNREAINLSWGLTCVFLLAAHTCTIYYCIISPQNVTLSISTRDLSYMYVHVYYVVKLIVLNGAVQIRK
jgi:hypothetical protein